MELKNTKIRSNRRFESAALSALLAATLIPNAPAGNASLNLQTSDVATAASVNNASVYTVSTHYFDGELITKDWVDSIVDGPVLAWGPGEEVDSNGNTVLKDGELWFMVPNGITMDYYHLSEEPSPSENSPVNYGGYTVLHSARIAIDAAENPDAVATVVVTTELWANSDLLGINHLSDYIGSRARATSQTSERSSRTSSKARKSTSSSISSAQVSSAIVQSGLNASGLGTLSPHHSSSSGQAFSIVAESGMDFQAATLDFVSLEYVGKIVETTAYSSGSDYSITGDVYDLNGEYYTSYGMTVIASTGVLEQSAQIQECKDLGANVQKGLEIWTDVTSLGASVVGGLFAVAAEGLTAGTATPVIGGVGVVYAGGVGGMNIFHKNLTAPLIAGLVENHCLGNIVEDMSLAPYLVTANAIDFSNWEPVLVCDEWVVITTTTSTSEDVEPADDAAYEVVVTGEVSQQTGCNIWHYEWREVQ